MPTMNQAKFMARYKYALSSDFAAADGTPATWGPNMPSHWGSESKKITLQSKASKFALSDDDSLLAVGIEKKIHIYDLNGPKLQQVLEGHANEVSRLAFAPKVRQGYRLLSYAEALDFGGKGSIIVWDLTDDGEDAHPPRAVDVVGVAKKASDSVLEELQWPHESKAAQLLAEEFRSALGAAASKKSLEDRTVLEGSIAGFGSTLFSRDGKHMFVLSHNTTTQHGMRDPELLPYIEIWDTPAMSLRHQCRGHTDAIMHVGVSPDGDLLASVAWDGTVRIWSVETGKCLHKFGDFGGQMWSGAWSPDSKHFAFSQGSPKTVVYVYSVETGEEVSKFEAIKNWARSFDWSPDGAFLAAGAGGGVVHVWNPMTGEEKMKWELKFDDDDDEYKMMKGFVSIWGVKFAGTKLVFQSTEGTAEVYDFATNLKSQFTRGPDDKVDSMVFARLAVSHSGKFLVSADADDSIRIWNL